MKRKVFALLTAGVIACSGLAFTGCKDDGSEENTVTFYHYAMTSTLNKQFKSKLEKFTEETGISVKTVPVSKDNYNSTISTKLTSSKRDIDLLYLDQPLLAQYAQSKILYKLDDYVTTDASDEGTVEADNNVGFKFNQSAFNQSAWKTAVFKDSVYAVPLTLNTSVFFYNVETIKAVCPDVSTDAQAVAKVEAIKTWNDLKAFADGIDGLGTDYALFGGMSEGGYMGWYSQCFIAAAGGKMYDEGAKTVLPDDDGSVTKAFEMMKYMFDKSPKTLYNTNTGFTGTNASPAGKVIFNLSHSGIIDDLDVAYTTFGAIPVPYDGEATNSSVSNIGGENLVIPQKSEHKTAALKLMRYLISDECMGFFQQCTKNFASVEKYSTVDTFSDDATSPVYKMYSVVKDQLATAQVRPVVAGWLEVNDNGIPTHLKKYIDGESALSKALSDIRSYAGQYLK